MKVDLLINQTNDMVLKQLKHVEDTFEVIRFGINKTVEDYTALMDKDFIVFINQTDSTRNSFRTGNYLLTLNQCSKFEYTVPKYID